MIRTGLAFCEVSFIRKVLAEKKEKKFFTSQELARGNHLSRAVHLSGVLAAKKAFLDALQKPGFQPLNQINIHSLTTGCPVLQTDCPSLKSALRKKKVCISISHTRKTGVAFCLIYSRKK